MRRCSLASLAAAMLIAAIPSGASAATTIGQTFPPETSNCGSGTTVLQTRSPNSQYAAPTAGVITSWSFQAGSSAPSDLKLKVGRSAGGDLFTIVGESPPKNPTADTFHTFNDVRIPVQAGDVIGYWNTGTGVCGRGGLEYFFRTRVGDQPPGTTEPYSPESSSFQINFSARLEPDCDKDGFGDETQDKNIASCLALTCKGNRLTQVGTDGNDNIVGTANRDVIAALGGNDKVLALDGNDIVCGNDGKDRLLGQDGEDILKGNRGKDIEKGGGGDDKLKGNRGADLLKGKGGEDFLGGGKGNDTCRGGRGDDKQKSC